MKLYDCKVRIMASVQDEVIKNGISQAEIVVLKTIHGDDAVSGVTSAGVAKVKVDPTDPESAERPRNEVEEREHLEMTYGEGIIAKIFGVPVARIGDDDKPSISNPRVAPAPKGRQPAPSIELEDV